MRLTVTIDHAGRVVLPKRVRDNMRLIAGSTLELELEVENEEERIILRPVRQEATLRKEYGIWVFQGPSADTSIPDLIEESREKRLRSLKG